MDVLAFPGATTVPIQLLLPLSCLLVFYFAFAGQIKRKTTPWVVAVAARYLLDQNHYRHFETVSVGRGSDQVMIDHLIVSRYGLFVIKVAPLNSIVVGGKRRKYWRQITRQGIKRFANPLHETYRQLSLLAEFLETERHKLLSVVVFPGDCSFKSRFPDNVVKGLEVIDYIKSKNNPILSAAEVESFKSRLDTIKVSESESTQSPG